jgi:hypothetical protein
MRLQAAATRFDRLVCTDAYTGAPAFKAQMTLYDGSKRDAEMTERRHLSAAPGVVVPPRRVIQAEGVRYIIGNSYPDSHNGTPIRQGLVAHEAADLVTVRTLAELCADQPGFTAWAGRALVKHLAFTDQTSALPRQEHFHFSTTEPVASACVISLGQEHYLVREADTAVAGTRVALADELPGPVVISVSFPSSGYDPVLETYGASSPPVRALQVRWQSLFRRGHRGAPEFGPEDVQLVVAKVSATPKPGFQVATPDGVRFIQSVMPYGDVWLCRAALHAAP